MIVDIRLDGADLALQAVGVSKRRVKKAIQKAIQETTQIETKAIGAEITSAHRLDDTFDGSRVKGSQKGATGKVWIGTKPIKSAYLGKLTQDRRGTRAGKHYYPGAFIPNLKSGHRGAFKRKDPATRWSKGRSRMVSPNLGIVEQVVKLDKIDRIMSKHRDTAVKKMQELFLAEIERQ